jgi:hypothetical protein
MHTIQFIPLLINPSRTAGVLQDLKEELKLGAMLQITSLEADASNLVSVIRSSYDVSPYCNFLNW